MRNIFNSKTKRNLFNKICKFYLSERPKINKSIYGKSTESDPNEVITPEVYEILKYGYPERRCNINMKF